MTFSLTNPNTPSYPSTRFPQQRWPDGNFCGGIIPLDPTMGVGYETNGEFHPLAADVGPSATSMTFADDISGIPTSGWFVIDQERIFYTGVDYATRTVTGLYRGGDAPVADAITAPASHRAGCVAWFYHMAINHNWLVDEFAALEKFLNDYTAAECAREAAQDAQLASFQTTITNFNNRLTTDEAAIALLQQCCTDFRAFATNGALYTISDGSGNSGIVHVGENTRFAGTGTITVTESEPGGGIHLVTINGSSGPAPSPTNWSSFPAGTDVDMACHALNNVSSETFCDSTGADPVFPTAKPVTLYEKDYTTGGASPTTFRRLFIRTNQNEERRLLTDLDLPAGGGGGGGGGDFLGPASAGGGASPASHTAGQSLNMNTFQIINASRITAATTTDNFIDLSGTSQMLYSAHVKHSFIYAPNNTQLIAMGLIGSSVIVDVPVGLKLDTGFSNGIGFEVSNSSFGGSLAAGQSQPATFNIPAVQPNNNYNVVYDIYDPNGEPVVVTTFNKQPSFIQANINNLGSGPTAAGMNIRAIIYRVN